MKNPFKYPLVTAPTNSMGTSWELDYDHPEWLSPMSKEQAEYAAYAINTYDKLVAERDKLRDACEEAYDLCDGITEDQSGLREFRMQDLWKIGVKLQAALLAGEDKL